MNIHHTRHRSIPLFFAISVLIASCTSNNFSGSNAAAGKRPNPAKEPPYNGTEDVTFESTTTVEDGGTIDPRLKCEMYLFTNAHHGCGPSRVASWAVWIGDKLPTLQNNAWPSADVLATAADQGWYGRNDFNGGCEPSKLLPTYKAMPNMLTVGTHEYPLFTGEQPGHIDCPSYRANVSPLVISFSNNKIELMNPSDGPMFDLDASGYLSRYSWPLNGSALMFLVHDNNGDGKITSGQELFGDFTTGPDKKTSENGFDALKKFDSNKDGKISSDDAIFTDLQVWGDENNNGISESTELHSLTSMHIKSIDLKYEVKPTRLDPFGSELKEISRVELDTGKSIAIGDVWFVMGASK